MKKTYIIPSLEVVKIHTNELLTGSLPVDESQEAPVTGGGDYQTLSRRGGFWDEEDEY